MPATFNDLAVTQITVDRELDVMPLGPRFGAEISGIDVATADDGQVDRLYRALIEYKVLVLRDQYIDDRAHVRLAQRLGETTVGHPVWDSGADVPDEVFSLDSTDNGQDHRAQSTARVSSPEALRPSP